MNPLEKIKSEFQSTFTPNLKEQQNAEIRRSLGIPETDIDPTGYLPTQRDTYDVDYLDANVPLYMKARELGTAYYMDKLSGSQWKDPITKKAMSIDLQPYDTMIKQPEKYGKELHVYNTLVKDLSNAYLDAKYGWNADEGQAWEYAQKMLDKWYFPPESKERKAKITAPPEGFGDNFVEFLRNFTAGREMTRGIKKVWPEE